MRCTYFFIFAFMNKLFLAALLFLHLHVLAQYEERPPYPSNILDFGIGAGPNYGVFGTKTVIGYKGNGFLFGAGTTEGLFAYQIGVQGSYQWFFANLCYGTVAGVSINNSPLELVNGTIVNLGGRINLLRNKKMFLELGFGYAFGAYVRTPFGEDFLGGPRGLIGLGFRVFDVKKKSNRGDNSTPNSSK